MIAGILFRNEMIKTSRRLAFWAGVLSFALLIGMMFGSGYYDAVRKGRSVTGFPEAWPSVLGQVGPMAIFFGAIVLMLLVSSEFSWRTARQNVIDGLSKREWFAGKLMLLPVVMASFLAVQIGIAGAFALTGTDFGSASPLIRAVDAAQLAGYTLGFLLLASLAFLLAVLLRASGAAIAVFFLTLVVLENLLGGMMRVVDERLGEYAAYLPMNVAEELSSRITWDAAAQAERIRRAVEAGKEAPAFLDGGVLTAVGLGYAALFLGVAYASFLRRDL